MAVNNDNNNLWIVRFFTPICLKKMLLHQKLLTNA